MPDWKKLIEGKIALAKKGLKRNEPIKMIAFLQGKHSRLNSQYLIWALDPKWMKVIGN